MGLPGDPIRFRRFSPSQAWGAIVFASNGAGPRLEHCVVDGASNVDVGSNVTLLSTPTLESIEEFKIITSSYAAEWPRSGGGIVNVVTKSGSNNFRASAYEFFRNDSLNANSYFRKQSSTESIRDNPPRLRYNNFGYTFGGPAKKDKLFFFFAQEWIEYDREDTFARTVPTAAMRAGDFSGASFTVNDPLTGEPFPGNVIPAEYDNSPEMIEVVRNNVTRAKVAGRLVANDETGAMVFSELLDRDPVTFEKLDYVKTAKRIEEVRQRFIHPKMYVYTLQADAPPLAAGEVIHTAYAPPEGLLGRFDTVEKKVTLEDALHLFKLPKSLGEMEDGRKITVAIGRFGPYVKFGDKYASIKEDDPYTITRERALELIAAKEHLDANRLIQKWEGSEIQVLNGRYGPYIKKGAETRSLETEEQLLAVGRAGTAHHVERIVRGWRRVDQQAEAREAALQHASRALHVYPDTDGTYFLRGRLTAEVGALLVQALAAARETLHQRARGRKAESDPPTMVQQQADALALLAETALHYGIDPGAPGERYQVVVHVDAEVLADSDQPGQSVLEDGGRVSAETSRRVACDASRVVMQHDRDGRVVEVAARTRTIPPALRRALQHRDRGCRFPGCGVRFGQGHHIRHWANGGPTTLSNLAVLCRRHHRAVHEQLRQGRRDPGLPDEEPHVHAYARGSGRSGAGRLLPVRSQEGPLRVLRLGVRRARDRARVGGLPRRGRLPRPDRRRPAPVPRPAGGPAARPHPRPGRRTPHPGRVRRLRVPILRDGLPDREGAPAPPR